MMRSWVEISLPRLRRNRLAVQRFLKRSGGSAPRLIAVVKANAYGHGIEKAARCLAAAGVDDFAVAQLDEALLLRRVLPKSRILVFGGILPGEESEYRRHSLQASVFDECPFPEGITVELKIDTGMTRLGVHWKKALPLIAQRRGSLGGVYSHLASADSDPEFTRRQIRRFQEAVAGVSCRRHLSNSAGLAFPEARFDAVRVGLALYGVDPCPGLAGVEPVLQWKTRILSVNQVEENRGVGYGGTYHTHRPLRLGVLPVGYADGYDRRFSNRAQVEVAGRLLPVIGLVSMDLTTIDLSAVPEAVPGDEVTLLSDDPESPLSAVSLARQADTIPYEILTSIGNRVERRYVENSPQRAPGNPEAQGE